MKIQPLIPLSSYNSEWMNEVTKLKTHLLVGIDHHDIPRQQGVKKQRIDQVKARISRLESGVLDKEMGKYKPAQVTSAKRQALMTLRTYLRRLQK